MNKPNMETLARAVKSVRASLAEGPDEELDFADCIVFIPEEIEEIVKAAEYLLATGALSNEVRP